MTILFLDFDGVLHPHEVYMHQGQEVELKAGPEHRLFEHADQLATLLEPFPEVHIVLSTSWCMALRRYDKAREFCPSRFMLGLSGQLGIVPRSTIAG